MSSERTPIEQLIVETTAAINARGLYGAQHPSLITAIERVVRRVDEFLAAGGAEDVTFVIVGDELLADQKPLRKESLFQRHFVTSLRRRSVERLTLAKGITFDEIARFIEAMSQGFTPNSTPHLIVGRVEAAFLDADSGDQEKGTGAAEDGATAERVERAKEAFTRFRTEKSVAIGQLEELVAGLVESLARSTRSMLPLAKLKDHDEYTFVHSINVSILVMSMARWHGFPNEQVQTIGLAGMLHDIGKLAIPLDVLNKPGRLEGEEWNLMMSHAERGAWYLASTPSTPPLPIVVAYEHHLRYDGRANYPVLSTPRRPNLASQMTSIADTFDAICTLRPYQPAKSRAAAIEIIRKRAGTFHDPFLVANFELMLQDVSDAP